jgi:tetratricopeptide (TPR) repeat protein
MSKKPFGAATIYVILGLLFIAAIGIRTISTPEIWTHLAQGRTNAPISFLESDTAINTTHLYDKVAYAMWNIGGAPLLIILNVIGLLASFILLLQVSKKWGGELSQGIALLIAGHLIFQGFDVGPQTLMMLFIALYVFLLSTLKKPAVLIGVLVPLQIVWTNTHGSFLYGPLIAALAAIQAGQGAGNGRKKRQGIKPETLGILAAGLLVATLVNPYFLKLHGQVVASIKAPYPAYWASLFREYFQVSSQNPLIFLVFIIGAGGLITLKKKLPAMLTTLAIIGAFLVMRSPSMSQLFAVLAFPFLVLSLTAVGDYLSESFRTFLGKQEKLLAPCTLAIFLVIFVVSLLPTVSNCAHTKAGSASKFGLGVQEELYPSGAAGAVIGHSAFPEKALNLAADGGYLAWKYPGRKIFVDYRAGRYTLDLLTQLNDMMLGDAEAYDTIYDAYRPEAIIINVLSPVAAQGLVTLLDRPVWKLAYFDGTTAILLLNKEEFLPILSDEQLQRDGLAQLEAARAAYAVKTQKGCRAGNSGELIGAAKIFLAFNRPAEAKTMFSLLLKAHAKVPGAWIGLGNSQLLLKEFDAATVSLQTATKLSPNNIFAWASYANACRYAGDTAEQKRAEEKVVSLVGENKTAEAEEAIEATTAEAAAQSLLDITIPE